MPGRQMGQVVHRHFTGSVPRLPGTAPTAVELAGLGSASLDAASCNAHLQNVKPRINVPTSPHGGGVAGRSGTFRPGVIRAPNLPETPDARASLAVALVPQIP